MSNQSISVGHTFGRLTVVEKCRNKNNRVVWKCKCSCGETSYVDTYRLIHNITTSCGCFRVEKLREVTCVDKTKDLLGKETENYKVTEYVGDNKWKCLCKHCNETFIRARTTIMNTDIKSCGCISHVNDYEDIENQRFERLVAKKYLGHSRWECICDCGNLTEVCLSDLKLKRVKSCGCLQKETHSKMVKDMRKEKRNPYKDWFIDSLYYEEDKERAKNKDVTAHEKLWFYCEKHGKFQKTVSEFIRCHNKGLTGCQKCATSFSNEENEIREFVKSLGYKVVSNSRKYLDGQEIDIYIPKLKIGIEYCGSAFHASENNPFESKPITYHQDKFLLAKSKGIRLITIFDKNFHKNKEEVYGRIKSILEGKYNIIDLSQETIYTNNDDGIISLEGYKETGQESPKPFEYKNCVVYDCGRTIWTKIL